MGYLQPNDYGFVQTPAPGGVAASAWTDVTLAVGSLVQDPAGIISSATYGATSSITFGVGDPGNIRGPLTPFAPDLPMWDWLIEDPFNFQAKSQVLVQVKLTATPNDAYLIYLGVYDGTVAINAGLYGSIGCTTGATGCNSLGNTPANGVPAASIVANGGNLAIAFNVDGAGNSPRDVMIRSTSPTGPAYGQKICSKNPTAWAGTAMRGFLGIGATASKGGGTFPGIQIRYQVIDTF